MNSKRGRRSRRAARRRRLWAALAGLLLLVIAAVTWRVLQAPDAAAYFADGERARNAHEFSTAIIHYKNALLANPANSEARWRLGQVYLAVKQIPEALSALESARMHGRQEPALWLDLARAQIESGKFEESLRSLESYTGPAQSEAQALRARANLGRGDPKVAKEVLAVATARDPQALSLQLATARLALSERDLPGAEAALEKALDVTADNPEALRLMGSVQLAQGRVPRAIAAFRQATLRAPDDVEGLAGLAEALLTDRQVDAAAEIIAQLAQKAPATLGAEFLNGWLAYAKEDWASAETALLGVVKSAPRHPQALLMLADSCFRLEKYNQAEAYLSTFDDAYPGQPPALKLLAAVHLKQRRATEAIKRLTPLAAADDADVGVLALLSYAYYAAGDTANGKALLARAQTLAPASALLQTQHALGAIAAGDEDAGINELEQLAAGPEGSAPRQALTHFHLMKGNTDAALLSAEALQTLNPQDPMAHNLLGIARAKNKDIAGATTAFEQALALDPKFAPARANLGLLAIATDEPAKGEALLREALAADRTYTAASLALATLADRRGASAEAMRLLEEAIAAQPQAPQPKWLLAARKLRTGDAAAGLELAKRAHAIAPKSAHSRLLWGTALLLAGQAGEAVRELDSLLTDVPDLLPAAAALGKAARATGQWDLARRSYRKVLAADPHSGEALWGLFAVEIAAKDYVEAENVIAAMARASDPVEAERARGELAAAQGRHGEAVTIFLALHQRAPSTATLLRLADAYQRKGDTDKLSRTLREWLSTKPGDTAVRLRLGNLELMSGRLREAQATFEAALEHAPDHPIALNNLAWLYDQADDERALALAERAYQALPDSAETADTLAWVLVKREQMQQALPLLEKAHERRPEEPNIQFHLAYVLAALGNQDKARGMLEALLGKETRFEAINDARALLRRLSEVEGATGPATGLRF